MTNDIDINESAEDWKKWVASINKEESEEQEEKEEIQKIDRKDINLQHFFDDMQLIGDQVRSNATKKPNFHYGDLSVTNYLLWLVYGELRILNQKGEQ